MLGAGLPWLALEAQSQLSASVRVDFRLSRKEQEPLCTPHQMLKGLELKVTPALVRSHRSVHATDLERRPQPPRDAVGIA